MEEGLRAARGQLHLLEAQLNESQIQRNLLVKEQQVAAAKMAELQEQKKVSTVVRRGTPIMPLA